MRPQTFSQQANLVRPVPCVPFIGRTPARGCGSGMAGVVCGFSQLLGPGEFDVLLQACGADPWVPRWDTPLHTVVRRGSRREPLVALCQVPRVLPKILRGLPRRPLFHHRLHRRCLRHPLPAPVSMRTLTVWSSATDGLRFMETFVRYLVT